MHNLSEQYLINKAEFIGRQLLEKSQKAGDGSITWGKGIDKEGQPILDAGLYNGRCGEGLFFSALYAATKKKEYRDITQKIFLSLVKGLKKDDYTNELTNRLKLGLTGLGGILYALVHSGQLVQELSLIEAAQSLSNRITPELVANDDKYDLIWGSTGALLGLIAVFDSGDKQALKKAKYCAKHLLTNRIVDTKTGAKVWPLYGQNANTGFAHGCAGIGHALIHLYQRTYDSKYYNAAIDAFNYERDLFRPHLLNWPDNREQSDDEVKMCSWCHGATGIGLSRLSVINCLKDEDESDVALDLKRAIECTLNYNIPTVDTLCCGHFGRIGFLLEASRKLENKVINTKMLKTVHYRLTHADQQGFEFSSEEGTRTHFKSGLFQGQTGVGYMLIRLTNPDKYPFLLGLI